MAEAIRMTVVLIRILNRNVTDDLCSLIKFCFAFIMVNFSTLCVLLLFMLKIIYLKKVLESFKIEKNA